MNKELTREEQVKIALKSKTIKRASEWNLENSSDEYDEKKYIKSCKNNLKYVKNLKIGNF